MRMICERCGREAHTALAAMVNTCIANLRADLAKARKEIEEIEACRAAPLATIRKLLGDDESPDEAIAGDICAMILTRRALGAKKREAEARVDELQRDLEAERARSWELARDLDLSKDAFRRLKEAYGPR